MGRRKTPQEKKRNAYKKDVVSVEEYPKSARVGRKRAKVKANRAYRHKVRTILHDPSDPEELESKGVSKVRRKKVWKSQVLPLGEAVAAKLDRRRERVAWNFFKERYRTEAHREAFVAFLEALVEGRTEESYELSILFLEMLEGEPHVKDRAGFGRDKILARKAWLQAFFKDEPRWEVMLRLWIAGLAERHGPGES